MGLNETVKHLHHLMGEITKDLSKALASNKSASRRVRKHTIKFAKVAKEYRKESIAVEKGGHKGKKHHKAKRKTAHKAKRAKKHHRRKR